MRTVVSPPDWLRVDGQPICVDGTNVIGITPFTNRTKVQVMSGDPIPDGDYELDAREIEGEPFGDIMAALEDLPEDETLILINSFEPEPLYDVLTSRGFEHETTQKAAGEWYVAIEHA